MAEGLEAEMTAWRARERKLEQMFGSEVLKSKEFLKEKLAHYEVLEMQFKGGLSIDRRLAIRIVREKRRELERELFPGFILRGLYRLAKTVLDRRRVAGYRQKKIDSTGRIRSTLEAKGFCKQAHAIANSIANGEIASTTNITQYISEKERVDFSIELKHGSDGVLNLSDCRARLVRSDGSKTGFISMVKNSLDQINMQQAYNLLSGRSVAIGNDWLQLDFNDKDSVGNYRTKVLPPSFGFDLEASLSAMKIKEMKHPDKIAFLVQSLRSGDIAEVHEIGKSEPSKISIDAQRKTIVKLNESKPENPKYSKAKVVTLNDFQKSEKQNGSVKIR